MKSEDVLQGVLDKTELPAKKYEYKGTKTSYIVYNEEDERGGLDADNMPQEMIVRWQVHLFMPLNQNYGRMKRKIRNLLLSAGFYLEDITTLKEKETQTVHVTISCALSENMEE